MRDGKRSDDGNERAETAERDHQAEQEQKMVGAVKNVEKTQVDEAEGGLVPARVEPDEAGFPGKSEGRNSPPGGTKRRKSAKGRAKAGDAGWMEKRRLSGWDGESKNKVKKVLFQ